MPATSGPGPLAPVHRLTIATAFLGAIAYLAFEVHARLFGAGGSWLRVAVALAATVLIGAYLRNLRARLAERLTPHDGPPPP